MTSGFRGLSVSIEQANYHVAQNGKPYFSFWTRLNLGVEYFSTAGWKYFPQDEKVTTPSQMKGPGHFFNTGKISAGLMQEITKAAIAYFAPMVESLRQTEEGAEAVSSAQ